MTENVDADKNAGEDTKQKANKQADPAKKGQDSDDKPWYSALFDCSCDED